MEFRGVHGGDDERNEEESLTVERKAFRRVEVDVENLKYLWEVTDYQCHYSGD
jgi:hypothetical protein